MVVVVVLEIALFGLQVLARPEERQVQAFPPNSADQSFYERMREWRVRRGFDFLHFEYSKIGLPLVEPEQRIVIRTEVFRSRLTSSRLPEHPAQRHSINDSGMCPKPNDLARILVHHDQYPVRSRGRRLAPEQIDAPQTVLHVAQKRKPGRTGGSRYRPGMNSQYTAHHVLVDRDTEGQSCLLRNSWTSPSGIAQFHWTTASTSSRAGPSGPGLRRAPGENRRWYLSLHCSMEAQKSGGFENDCRMEQATGAHQKRAEPGDEAIGDS
jgi:hypothetical protein